MSDLDPLTLTVIQSSLQQVCDEMDLTFSRAAFSPIISEADDRSDGIYSAEDGSLVARGLGDVYAVNDPYLGGTHLMDVRFAMPVFRSGEVFCWLSNVGHWPDIGGSVPGSFSASATAVEQEGLRFPLRRSRSPSASSRCCSESTRCARARAAPVAVAAASG